MLFLNVVVGIHRNSEIYVLVEDTNFFWEKENYVSYEPKEILDLDRNRIVRIPSWNCNMSHKFDILKKTSVKYDCIKDVRTNFMLVKDIDTGRHNLSFTSTFPRSIEFEMKRVYNIIINPNNKLHASESGYQFLNKITESETGIEKDDHIFLCHFRHDKNPAKASPINLGLESTPMHSYCRYIFGEVFLTSRGIVRFFF